MVDFTVVCTAHLISMGSVNKSDAQIEIFMAGEIVDFEHMRKGRDGNEVITSASSTAIESFP